MPRYRMSIDVNAEQFLPDEDKIPAGVTSDGPRSPKKDPKSSWVIRTDDGMTYLRNGQYVVEKGDGSHYVMEKDFFEANYKPINGE